MSDKPNPDANRLSAGGAGPSPEAGPRPGLQPPQAPRKRRRVWIWIAGVIAVILTLGLALALSAPTVLSSGFGRSLILRAAAGRVPGVIRIRSIRLAWFGGQSIRDFELLDREGDRTVACKEIATDGTLWNLLVRRHYDLGSMRLVGLEVNLKESKPAPPPPPRPKTAPPPPKRQVPPPPPKPARVPSSLAGAVELKDASIRLGVGGKNPVVVSDLNGSVKIKTIGEPIRFQISGQTKQGDVGGAVSANGEIRGVLDADGVVRPERAEANVKLSANDFPVDGIDRLLAMDGRLRAALGPQLTLSASSLGTSAKNRIEIKAQSQNLTGDLAARLEKGQLSLSRPAVATLEITPSLVQALASAGGKPSEIQLREKAPLQLTVAQLSAPLGSRDLSSVALEAGITLGDLNLSGIPDIGEASFRTFQATIEAPRLTKEAHVGLTGSIEQSGRRNPVELDAVLKDWLDNAGALQTKTMQAQIKANLPDLPVGLFDRLADLNGLLSQALGPELTVTATVTGNAGQQTAKLALQSARLTFEAPLAIGEAISLTGPATGQFKVSPALVKRFAPGESAPRLRDEAVASISIPRFSAPLPTGGQPFSFKPQDIVLDASLAVGEMNVAGLPQVAEATVTDLKAQISGKSLASADVTLSANVAPKGKDPLVIAAVGPSAKLELSANSAVTPAGSLGLSKFHVQIVSENLNATAQGRLTDKLALTAPVKVDFTLTPALLEILAPGKPQQPTVAGPTPIHLTLAPFEAPLKGLALDSLPLSAKASIPEMALAGDPRLKGMSLRDGSITLDFDPAANSAKMAAEANVLVEGQAKPARLSANGQATGLLHGGRFSPVATAFTGTASLTGVPVDLAEALSGAGGRLKALFGSHLNLELAGQASPGPVRSGTLDVKAQGEDMNAAASVKLGEELALSSPAKLHWTLTPAGFASLMSAPPKPAAKPEKGRGEPEPKAASTLALAAPATIDATIQSFRCPKRKTGAFDPSRAEFDVAVSAPRLALSEPAKGRTTVLEQLQGSIRCAGAKQPVVFRLTGRAIPETAGKTAAASSAKAGAMEASGEITDLFTDAGAFNAKGLSAKVKATVSDLPSAAVDSAMGGEGKMAALFGDSVGVNLNADLKNGAGPVNAKFTGTSGHAEMEGELTPEGLKLRTPAQGQAPVTTELTHSFLKKINPLLLTAVGSEKPIQMTVSPSGFFVPTTAPIFSRIEIPEAQIDLGTILLQKGGELEPLLELLNVKTGDQMTARFTPLKVHVKDGVATYEPMEVVIADRVQLVTWGQVDLVRDEVDMQLGIKAETLEKLLGVKGLDPQSSVVVPMKGPTSKVRIDWKKAAEQVAKLVVGGQLKIDNKNVNNLLNQFLGGKQKSSTPGSAPAESTSGFQATEPKPGQAPPASAPQSQPSSTKEKKPKKEEVINDVLNLLQQRKR